jgi:hypothetical protein
MGIPRAIGFPGTNNATKLPEHGFASGDGPPTAAHFPGLVYDPLDLLQPEFPLAFRRISRNPQPTMPAVVVAAVGEIQAPFQGEAGNISHFL